MGSSGSSDNTIRYSEYLENAHQDALNDGGDTSLDISLFTAMNSAFNQSPYGTRDAYLPERGYFGYKSDGETLWTLEEFPSLFDMFGKFMAGLDVCTLWGKVYTDIVDGPDIDASIRAHSAILKDEIDGTLLPSFIAGMRDINAIQSSAFVVGKALLYDGHTKSVNKFGTDIRLKAVDAATQVWAKHLEWNREVVQVYSKIIEAYFIVKLETDIKDYEYSVKDELWNLNLFEYARAMLGALNGAAAATGVNEPSQTRQAISGALGGAAVGAQISGGNPAGAVIGGLIGLAGSFF